MSAADVLRNLHPNEKIPLLARNVLETLRSLHISCGVNCLEVTKSHPDFIGICIFHKDGSKILEDNRKRIKSGYIFAESSDRLKNVQGNTFHRRAYNLMFEKIEDMDGVLIVGFAQQGRKLKGTSRTFNSDLQTNLLPSTENDGKALFTLRTLIFGSIIVHKINVIRNVTPHSACLAMCLFLIVKADGDKDDLARFPVADIDLDNQEIFLREFFGKYQIQENILKVAFKDPMTGLGPLSFLTLGVDKRLERWTRAKWAMKQLVEGFQADMTAADFQSFMGSLSATYNTDTFIGTIISWLMALLGIAVFRGH